MRRPVRSGSRGQAFCEALVVVVFLIPLILSMFFLVDLMRAEQASVATVREWLLTAVHEPAGRVSPGLQDELRAITITPGATPGNRHESRIGPSELQSAPLQIERAAMQMLLPARAVGVGEFDLPALQSLRASSAVSLGPLDVLKLPLDSPIELREQTVFFAGHGAAATPQQVRDRTAALSVAGALAEVARPIEIVALVASVIEPSLRRLCLGRIDPDIVPADRLPAEITQANDLRYRSC